MQVNKNGIVNIRHAIIMIILWCLCLAHMPYGYFMLVRFLTAMSCAYWGYKAYEDDKQVLMWVFIGIAILFQPLIKIPLGRLIRNILDVLLSIYILCLTIFLNKKSS